ncbi:RiboL-PSP-HEPN domain-containing protein [Nostoc sp. DSM 114167]
MVIQNSLNTSTRLEDVSRELWQFIGSYESCINDPAKCKHIHQKLSHFNQTHSDNSDHIYDVIQGLSKGFYLIKSGLEWQEPAVGHSSVDKPNDTHKARGIQWRLVMTWGGFETITKTLLLKKSNGGLKTENIKSFTVKCDLLNNYNPLNPPDSRRVNLEKWLNINTSIPGKSALADFLSLGNGDQEIIENWIVKSQPISNWVEAVRLAKALRNATAHGALSATKVKEWGLQKPLLTLSENLAEIVVAAMQKLV